MDMDKFVEKLSQSQEFMELLNRERIRIQEEAGEYDEEHVNKPNPLIREVKRARLMEPAVDEGEWLLKNSGEHVGEDIE